MTLFGRLNLRADLDQKHIPATGGFGNCIQLAQILVAGDRLFQELRDISRTMVPTELQRWSRGLDEKRTGLHGAAERKEMFDSH